MDWIRNVWDMGDVPMTKKKFEPEFMYKGQPLVDGPSWWTEPQREVIATVQVESVDIETNTIWLKPVEPKK
jgi:hypothetical protein